MARPDGDLFMRELDSYKKQWKLPLASHSTRATLSTFYFLKPYLIFWGNRFTFSDPNLLPFKDDIYISEVGIRKAGDSFRLHEEVFYHEKARYMLYGRVALAFRTAHLSIYVVF